MAVVDTIPYLALYALTVSCCCQHPAVPLKNGTAMTSQTSVSHGAKGLAQTAHPKAMRPIDPHLASAFLGACRAAKMCEGNWRPLSMLEGQFGSDSRKAYLIQAEELYGQTRVFLYQEPFGGQGSSITELGNSTPGTCVLVGSGLDYLLCQGGILSAGVSAVQWKLFDVRHRREGTFLWHESRGQVTCRDGALDTSQRALVEAEWTDVLIRSDGAEFGLVLQYVDLTSLTKEQLQKCHDQFRDTGTYDRFPSELWRTGTLWFHLDESGFAASRTASDLCNAIGAELNQSWGVCNSKSSE